MKYLLPIEQDILNPYFILLLVSGLYISYKLRFPQFRHLFLSLKIFSGIMDDKSSKGQLVHSQALFAGTGSSLLIGSTLGSIFAMMIGGVGSLFWIWVMTLLVMPIRVVSSTLAIRFRNKLPNGRYLAGPMYFIEKALRAKWLAIIFAVGNIAAVITLGGISHSLAVTYVTNHAFGFKGLTVPLVISVLMFFIILGGIRRIGRIAGTLIPIGFVLFFFSYYGMFKDILLDFFPFIQAVVTSACDPVSISIGTGISILGLSSSALGSFFISTEIGIGKSAGISGVVRTDSAAKQGLVMMISSLIEGFVVSTLIFYLLYSYKASALEDQITLLNSIIAQGQTFYGFLFLSSYFIFSFISICGWFYTGEQSAFYIKGETSANLFRILFFTCLLGAAYLFYLYGNDVILYAFNIGYTMILLISFPVLVSLVLLVKIVAVDLNKFLLENNESEGFIKDIYILLLSALPKNLSSKLFGLISYVKLTKALRIPVIKTFARMYKINIQEAELPISEYNSLNKFFTRALKEGARPINPGKLTIVSPVDARITNLGPIHDNLMIQAKGFDYSLKELIGEKYYETFNNGQFITFYLSPQDYHRIHSPFTGRILGYYYEPGKLFPVNNSAVNNIQSLFPKNERLITFLQTEYGKIAVVKVGASNVGKIRVTYDSQLVTNKLIRVRKEMDYTNVEIKINKGSELGRFEMGSTVILIFENNSVKLNELIKNTKIQMGNKIGEYIT